MEFCFAPMEGVTGSIYRRIHAECFPGVDFYYAPFIAPDSSGRLKGSALRDILPETSGDYSLVPQILCNTSAAFLAAAQVMADLGYREINLNIGCPSGTVVSKHKGAGMLADLSGLERCLDGIFSSSPVPVSIKTRLGLSDSYEFPSILSLYRRYPISRLIIHARTRSGMYKSLPDLEAFSAALQDSPFPVIYNGDVFCVSDYEEICLRFPDLSGVMIGRGAAADPSLFRRIRGGPPLDREEFSCFHERLLTATLSSGLAPYHTVQRMKELWFYMGCLFPGTEKAQKGIFHSRSLSDYRTAVSTLISAAEPNPESCFNR